MSKFKDGDKVILTIPFMYNDTLVPRFMQFIVMRSEFSFRSNQVRYKLKTLFHGEYYNLDSYTFAECDIIRDDKDSINEYIKIIANDIKVLLSLRK